eukprot:9214716-Lingulodinium_polyedra.AAC.1
MPRGCRGGTATTNRKQPRKRNHDFACFAWPTWFCIVAHGRARHGTDAHRSAPAGTLARRRARKRM